LTFIFLQTLSKDTERDLIFPLKKNYKRKKKQQVFYFVNPKLTTKLLKKAPIYL